MNFSEIIIIILVAVLIFGPDKIPGIARGLGQGFRAMKNATDDIKREIMSQIDESGSVKEIQEEIQQAKKSMEEVTGEASQNLNTLVDDTFEGSVKRS
ncbi:MAG: twin-arginine translocase TatA/TatE family subunit [Flavobacteriaceae bacterium]|nr:twin-arginine translocase TatA/TatE family subunit [Flavobacteriaceae bacterium]